MVIPEPRFHVLAEPRGEGNEFAGFIDADAADRIVFGGVAFAAAGVEIIGIVLTSGAEDEGQSLQGAVVREVFLGAEALGLKKDGAKLERGVVGDAKLPVVRKTLGAGVFQVAVGDGEEFGDLRGAGAVGTQPAVTLPGLQAHGRLL